MTNIVIRSEILRYYFCHLEYLEEQIISEDIQYKY